MSWVKIGCGLRGGMWGRIFCTRYNVVSLTMANIYRPKILFIVMLWFDQLLKRAWSNKIRSHISRVKRLEFASECEPLFLGPTLNSRQKKNIFKCCDYFHFSPYPIWPFLSSSCMSSENLKWNLNGFWMARVRCGWHIRSFMISFDVLIRFSCSESGTNQLKKRRSRKERRLPVKSWTLWKNCK